MVGRRPEGSARSDGGQQAPVSPPSPPATRHTERPSRRRALPGGTARAAGATHASTAKRESRAAGLRTFCRVLHCVAAARRGRARMLRSVSEPRRSEPQGVASGNRVVDRLPGVPRSLRLSGTARPRHGSTRDGVANGRVARRTGGPCRTPFPDRRRTVHSWPRHRGMACGLGATRNRGPTDAPGCGHTPRSRRRDFGQRRRRAPRAEFAPQNDLAVLWRTRAGSSRVADPFSVDDGRGPIK